MHTQRAGGGAHEPHHAEERAGCRGCLTTVEGRPLSPRSSLLSSQETLESRVVGAASRSPQHIMAAHGRAVYDFDAAEQTELSFKAGDRIHIKNRVRRSAAPATSAAQPTSPPSPPSHPARLARPAPPSAA